MENLLALDTITRARPVKQIRQFFQEFFDTEASSGIILIISALVALVWANSPWADSYLSLWQIKLTIGLEGAELSKPILLWINDGLMAIFFLVVGLEIKREILSGELASLKKAALPVAAAVGGMVVPALIYVAFNAGSSSLSGWGIPMATDIAFALGILALLGSRAPLALKIFLTAVAIVDDIGAVLVIALFYTAKISTISLVIAGGFLLALFLANRLRINHPLVYIVLGIGLWVATLKSGVHATIAGVLLAFTIPIAGTGHSMAEHGKGRSSLLHRMEHTLHPWVAYAIMPIFALANAGVVLTASSVDNVVSPISLGVVSGLLFGKQIGIMLAAWLMVLSKLAALPDGVTWRHIYGVSWLAGIGFTMSLFITNLAFENGGPSAMAKSGILAASLIAGFAGWLILRSAHKTKPYTLGGKQHAHLAESHS